MAFGKKPSSGEMRGKREKSDKAMRGKMPKSDAKPAAKKAAPKKASPFEGGGSPFPFAGGGSPMMPTPPMPADRNSGYGMDRMQPGPMGAMAGAGPRPRVPGMPAPRPGAPGMADAVSQIGSAMGGGMMGGKGGMMPQPGPTVNDAMPAQAPNPYAYAKGGKVCMADGGGVGDAIRKFVGMPTKKRGEQLERQEQEILNPPAPDKKK